MPFLLFFCSDAARAGDGDGAFLTGLDRAYESVPDPWTIDRGLEDVEELSFSNDPETPGIVYREPDTQGEYEPANQSGQAQAWAPWAAGSGPFEMTFKIRIDRMTPLSDRDVGFFIGLSTGRPGKMSEEDLTIAMAVNRTGVTSGMVGGGRFDSRRTTGTRTNTVRF